ncbi:MAG: YdbL family protein [Gammaproteobacteria bacterium]
MHTKHFPRSLRQFTRVLFTAGALLSAAGSWGEDRPLDAPRAQGLIGERFDGYAAVHDSSASAAIRSLVDSTNSERRKIYEKQAAVTNAPIEEVGKVYAAEILQKAPAGTWFQAADGRWTQK